MEFIEVQFYRRFQSVKLQINRALLINLNRKDHIGHEHSASKRWPENWGFLIGQYKIVSFACFLCQQRNFFCVM